MDGFPLVALIAAVSVPRWGHFVVLVYCLVLWLSLTFFRASFWIFEWFDLRDNEPTLFVEIFFISRFVPEVWGRC